MLFLKAMQWYVAMDHSFRYLTFSFNDDLMIVTNPLEADFIFLVLLSQYTYQLQVYSYDSYLTLKCVAFYKLMIIFH